MQLIIDSYGAYLHIKDELFEVRIKKEENEIKKHFASQKVSSILLSKGAAISTDAIILAMKNNIDIVVLEYDGKPVGRFWHSKLGSTSKIRKKQLEASLNDKCAGLYRVQKSVFLGTIEENDKDTLKLQISELIDTETDSVYIFPMSKPELKQTVLLGQAFDKKLVTDEVKALFI